MEWTKRLTTITMQKNQTNPTTSKTKPNENKQKQNLCITKPILIQWKTGRKKLVTRFMFVFLTYKKSFKKLRKKNKMQKMWWKTSTENSQRGLM